MPRKKNKKKIQAFESENEDDMEMCLPELIVFDLDDTIWNPEMYMLRKPFQKKKNGAVQDGSGQTLEFLGDAKTILYELATAKKWENTEIAYCSRTNYASYAKRCLQLMTIDKDGKKSMESIVDYKEIYPGDKKTHFKRIQKSSGISFNRMLFFDNEYRNVKSVSSLGVLSVHTPYGLTRKKLIEGINLYDANNIST